MADASGNATAAAAAAAATTAVAAALGYAAWASPASRKRGWGMSGATATTVRSHGHLTRSTSLPSQNKLYLRMLGSVIETFLHKFEIFFSRTADFQCFSASLHATPSAKTPTDRFARLQKQHVRSSLQENG